MWCGLSGGVFKEVACVVVECGVVWVNKRHRYGGNPSFHLVAYYEVFARVCEWVSE